MKKLIISAFAMALLSFGSAGAKNIETSGIVTNIPQEKVAVKPEDLPEPVKTTLASDTYAGWQVTSAFLITKEDNSQFYEVSMRKGEESSTVNLDKDGRKVE